MNKSRNPRRSSLARYLLLLISALLLTGILPVVSQDAHAAPDALTFSITVAKLGYGERVLESSYAATEYLLRLPEGWELRAGSFFELDYSYGYNRLGGPDGKDLSYILGEIIITIDGQPPSTFPIKDTMLEHSRLSVELPPEVINDPARKTHSIKVALDASPLCNIPHTARLTLHSTSMFSLNYDQLPIVADLSLYPRPFYQRSFEQDQVRFVLPTQPTEPELKGAMAVAAKLGDLAYRIVISGTTDQELLGQLDVKSAVSREHLIVIGKPEANGVILRLNNLGMLPMPLRERQLSLSSEALSAVAPGDTLTYMLTVANTTPKAISDLALMDMMPARAQLVSCSPTCSEAAPREARWSIPSLAAGEAAQFTLALRVSDAVTTSILENTITLFDASSSPLNVNVLTTTVSTALPQQPSKASSASQGRYFFTQGTQAVPEHDGVVQELVSPWDQTRAILVITGLSDQAVYKASLAMALENYLLGMQGSGALVQDVRLPASAPSKTLATDMTFAGLGYEDKVLRGYFEEANYSLDIPAGWQLTEEAYIDLRFSHSTHLLETNSYLNVLFNDKPIANVALDEANVLDGKLKVKLPASQARPGSNNRFAVQARLYPIDACSHPDMWVLLSNTSALHLDHNVQSGRVLDLGLYLYPFNQRPDLGDVMFVLPAEPVTREWEAALQLAAALGNASYSANFVPAVALGNSWPKDKLGDYHWIAIGRPSRNVLLQQANTLLPQPFSLASDSIEQTIDQVTFRLPPGISLGYIQLIPSPWNEARAILAVTGTTDDGWQDAMNIVLRQPWQLKGNLVLIRNGQVKAIDTRAFTRAGAAMALATAVPQMSPVPAATTLPAGAIQNVSAPQPSASARPAWLVPVIGMTGLTILVILVIAFWQARRGKL